jgi:uncharacterized protein (TIGR02453 family)
MFTNATFEFLGLLAANNNKAWFEQNKPRYEALVREPALNFIEAIGPLLNDFAPLFNAIPRKVGGSLMRVYRDTRFSADKTPFKTNVGIHFRHALGKDVHAPGFYVHIATDECFLGAGCWQPEPEVLGKIRDAISQKPEQWITVRDMLLAAGWQPWGESLSRPPRGYAADHVAIEDLKRKHFIGIAPLTPDQVTRPDFASLVAGHFAETVPFMRYLCEALEVQY